MAVETANHRGLVIFPATHMELRRNAGGARRIAVVRNVRWRGHGARD